MYENVRDALKTSEYNDGPLVTVSKTERVGCEWCEGELSFEVVWYSFGSSFVDVAMFCPNCGRKLREYDHE